MTVLDDGITMAESDDTQWLDDMFERLEKILKMRRAPDAPLPE